MALFKDLYNNKFNKFIFDDYHPLDGRIKIILYLLLFIKGYNFFLYSFIERTSEIPLEFFEPDGVMRLLPSFIEIGYIKTFIEYTISLFIISWVCSIIGLFGRFPYFLTGLLAFLYLGFDKFFINSNHTYYLPVYALVLFGFTFKNDQWSLDFLIGKYFPNYHFKPQPDSPNFSGVSLKALLILTAFSFFSAGFTKLANGGFDWVSAETLYYYLGTEQKSGFLSNFLIALLKENRWLVKILSVTTIIFELIALVTIFSKRSRPYFFLGAIFFHLGIWLVMKPNFFIQSFVYIVLINWSDFFKSLKCQDNVIPDENKVKLMKYGFSSLIIICVLTSLFQIEQYPLSHFPMYGESVSLKKRGRYSIENFNERENLRVLSKAYIENDRPFSYPNLLFHYFVIEKKDSTGEWVSINNEILESKNKKTWKRRFATTFALDYLDYYEHHDKTFKRTKHLMNATKTFLNNKNNKEEEYRAIMNILNGNLIAIQATE